MDDYLPAASREFDVRLKLSSMDSPPSDPGGLHLEGAFGRPLQDIDHAQRCRRR